jgi:hypothetical protein
MPQHQIRLLKGEENDRRKPTSVRCAAVTARPPASQSQMVNLLAHVQTHGTPFNNRMVVSVVALAPRVQLVLALDSKIRPIEGKQRGESI